MKNLFFRKFFLFAVFLTIALIVPVFRTSQASDLVPTIHAKATGGNWSYSGMWEEERAPGPDDVVEINGTVTLNVDAEIAGLVINSEAVLQPKQSSATPREFTLTVNGDIINHGAMKDLYANNLYYGDLILNASGDLKNTGSLENEKVDVNNFINSGEFSSLGLKVRGNVSNSGTVAPTSYIEMSGSGAQEVSSSTPLGYLFIKNNTLISGDLITDGRLSIDSGFIVTFGDQNSFTANSWVLNNGEINGGEFILGGADQNFYNEGVFNVEKLVLGGTGIKTMKDNKTVNGNVEVLAEVTLQPFKSSSKPTYTLDVDGDITNYGTIQDDFANTSYYGRLNLQLTGSLVNLGTMTNNDILLAWEPDPLADYYEIRFSDSDLNWMDPEIIAIFTISIKGKVDDNSIWQVRSVVSDEPGAWSTVYAINASEVLVPELNIIDAAEEKVATDTAIDFGQIDLDTPLQKIFTITNTKFRDLIISSISLTGDPNFTLELLDGDSITLAPGESHTFGINFAAIEGETSGSRQTVLSFNTNDENNPSFIINFSGQVLLPDPVPVLTEVTPIPEVTWDNTPDYTFHSTEAGTLIYEGPCQSPVTQINEGNTTLTFNPLSPGYYDYCFLMVSDADGNLSDPLPVSPFTVDQVSHDGITWEQVIHELRLWQAFMANKFQTEGHRLKKLEKRMGKFTKKSNKGNYNQAAKKARQAIAAGYNDIEGLVEELKDLMPDDLDRLKRILIKKPMEKMYGGGDGCDDEDPEDLG